MNKSTKTLVWVAIIFAILTLIVCTFPFLFTHYSILNFTETGQIGDTIGGIMSPFIGIIAAILTFLAFWIQYKANEEQKKSIEENRKEIMAQQERYELDRFESKLSMMMNLYQENVKSIECGGKTGRLAFAELLDELRLTYELVEYALINWIQSSFKHDKPEYDKEVRDFHCVIMTNEAELRRFLTETAYTLFFYGKPYFSITETKQNLGKVIAMEMLYKCVSKIEKSISANSSRTFGVYMITQGKKSYRYNAPEAVLQGRSRVLAPYYRQLFSIARYIDGCKIPKVGFNEKYDYFKQLRCLMSDEEQAILYYNSISPLGKSWNTFTYTSSEDVSLDSMGLLARYRLVKNLPPRFPFFGISPMEFYQNETAFFKKQGKKFYEHESFYFYEPKIKIVEEEKDGVVTRNIVMNI